MTKIYKRMPREIPEPELLIRDAPRGAIYCWGIDYRGILGWGDSKAECVADWTQMYRFEYNIAETVPDHAPKSERHTYALVTPHGRTVSPLLGCDRSRVTNGSPIELAI